MARVKRCSICGEEKQIEDMKPNSGECRPCNKLRSRRYYYMSRYGITLEEYELMLEAQDHKCAICGKDGEGTGHGKKLLVDHDHLTGKLRGLLCSHCNSGLGYLGEFNLMEAMAYVGHHWGVAAREAGLSVEQLISNEGNQE